MSEDIYYYLGFSHFLGIGPIRFAGLMKKFGRVKEAYRAGESELTEVIGKNLAEKFVRFRANFDPEKKREELKRKKIEVIPLFSTSYPESLKNISDPPICLYGKGDINILRHVQDGSSEILPQLNSPRRMSGLKHPVSENFDSPSLLIFFAIVGTRKPTPYGEQIAKKFAFELSSAGFIIVSGMAMGIDAVAHQAALDADGKTIAVLGCGVDIIYPAVNSKLYHQIIEKGGAVISEFPPGHLVQKGLFIARNRIISGMSAGVLVVEGLKDSGALITARYAAEQGKEVFAPPGPLTSPFSQAPNILLKQGAKLVTSVEDIIEEFGLKILPKAKKEIEADLTSDEKIIFTALQSGPKLVDEIITEKNLAIETVLNALSVLEIKGAVEKNSEGKYQIRL